MILDSVSELESWLGRNAGDGRPPFKQVLMVSPEYFRVEYAINPFMKMESGELQQVDLGLACQQWDDLFQLYEKLGFPVEVLPGHPELPDMVFAANQTFPFWDPKTQRPSVILGRMHSEHRRPEVLLFRPWFEEAGYTIQELGSSGRFEGNGDALLHPGLPLIWGGYGPRTSREVYEEIARRWDLAVVPLSLDRPEFYHLDTCFSILNEKTVAIQPEAFSSEDRKLIEAAFENVIAIDFDENLRYFAGNCHSPNGRDVILQQGSKQFAEALAKAGFTVHPLDTSEFLKSGGSVFCLKQMVF